MSIARALILAGVFIAAAPLSAAARDDVQDLRGYVGFPPSYDAPHQDSIAGGVRVGAEFVRSFTRIDDRIGGWIWGAEGAISHFDHDRRHGTIVAATGEIGYAYRLPPRPEIHFEGAPFIGLGFADKSIPRDDGTDGYFEVGVRAGAYWTFATDWQAGVELRLIHSTSGDTDQDGVMPCLVGGYRFQ